MPQQGRSLLSTRSVICSLSAQTLNSHTHRKFMHTNTAGPTNNVTEKNTRQPPRKIDIYTDKSNTLSMCECEVDAEPTPKLLRILVCGAKY